MAEITNGADDLESMDGADEPTDDSQDQMTGNGQPGGGTTDQLADKSGRGPEDPNDPQYKYWQAAYTQTRQRERQHYGQVEQEHKQYGDVLRQFYQSDEYALQVLRQRFPQLAQQLSMDSSRSASPGTPSTQPSHQQSAMVQALEQRLGKDLAFLAPTLGPVLEDAIQAATRQAVAPIHQQTQQHQEAVRKRQEETLLAEMDSSYPGWESRYGSAMQELDAFFGSDELSHPKYGNKYELMLKILNPDMARIEATREMNKAGKARLTTSRTGRQSTSNIESQVLGAKNNADAFQLAAQAALRELGHTG